ncbi:MAG TPA: ABC transporter substrate-binding protein [Candidatus Acidoferrum sp.]|nr:ABC transporter substrate-binding protein [Candidatus Acidoferrum sp.]
MRTRISPLLAAAILLVALPAAAEETLKLAIGQRGNWDTAVAELGQRAGIFARHGLKLELLYTAGGGETQQAVISGSVDIGVAAGSAGVIGAYLKGAPVRVIGGESTGAADYWYVPASSPVKSIKDVGGKTMAYSTNGSSTHSAVLGFIKQFGVKPTPTATGSPPATFTQVMSRQVDIGWAAPPFGLDAVAQGKIRIVARANDLPSVKSQTVRFLIANAGTLEKRKPAIAAFLAAYRETIAWMYSNPAAIKTYAEFAKISEAQAQEARDKFFAREMLDPDRIEGLDTTLAQAVEGKFVPNGTTKDKIAGLFQLLPRK